MIPSGIPLISFVLFLLAGLTFTVFNDPYIRRSHRTAMLIIIALCLSLVVQNYVENWLSEGEPRITVRTLTAIFGYIVRPLIIIMFFHINTMLYRMLNSAFQYIHYVMHLISNYFFAVKINKSFYKFC